jgi:hypothetical protein
MEWAKDAQQSAAVRSSEASWRQMLPVLSPATIDGLVRSVEVHLDPVTLDINAIGVNIPLETSQTMGMFYDIAYEIWLQSYSHNPRHIQMVFVRHGERVQLWA